MDEPSSSTLNHVTLRGLRIELGEAIPAESDVIFRPKSGLEGLLSENEIYDRQLLEFVDDPSVTIVMRYGLVNGIIVESGTRYFDQLDLAARISISSLLTNISGFREGHFGSRYSYLKSFNGGTAYITSAYDCNTEFPQPTGMVHAIILVAVGVTDPIPGLYGFQCPDRL
jgi:hypothetical protein